MQTKKILMTSVIVVTAALAGVGGAYAATQTVTATIKFLTDLTIAQVTAPNFGYVKAAQVGTYVLDTTGAITPSGGGVVEGGVPAAGNYLIKGSGSQIINISTGGYTVSGASTPSAATCKYGAGAAAACTLVGQAAPTAGGTTLLMGLQIATTAAAIDGQTDTPSLTLTVVYQ